MRSQLHVLAARTAALVAVLGFVTHVAAAPATAQPAAATDSTADSSATADEVPERLRGFLTRKATRRGGHFFDLAQIQAGSPQRLSEVIRRVPGVRLGASEASGSTVRLRGCRPLVWLDGVRGLGTELDEQASVADVAAIEVYVSPAAVPAEFRDHRVGCGTILLWSRS